MTDFLNGFERSLGRSLTADEEEFLYRLGKDEDGEPKAWWVCNSCGESPLCDELRHTCRRSHGMSLRRVGRMPGVGDGNDWAGSHT